MPCSFWKRIHASASGSSRLPLRARPRCQPSASNSGQLECQFISPKLPLMWSNRSLCCSMMCPSASMTNSAIVMPPDLMLLTAAAMCRPDYDSVETGFRVFDPKLLVERSLQKNLLIFFLFDFVVFFAERVHLHELNLIGIGQRWINTLTIDELAGLCLDSHA